MRFLSLLLLATLLLSSAGSEVPWITLLPTENLDSWRSEGGRATFRLEEGEVVGQTTANSANTFLCTRRNWGDFELEYEFLCNQGLNSGVQIRSEVVGKKVRGYQIEIDVDKKQKRFWSAGVYEEGGRGWLDDLSDNKEARDALRPTEWNRVRVVAVGDRIQTWLNGVPAADLIDPVSQTGFIGLQVHGVGGRKDPLEVRWRSMRIRDLGEHRWQAMASFIFADPDRQRVEPQEVSGAAIASGRSLRMRTRLESQTLTLLFRGLRVVIAPGSVSLEDTGGRREALSESLARAVRKGEQVTLARIGTRAVLHVGDRRGAQLKGLSEEPPASAPRWRLQGAGLRVWDVAVLIPVESR